MPKSREHLLTRLRSDKFGRLRFMRDDGWPQCEFACDCGATKKIRVFNVLRGRTKSCGCGEKENLRAIAETGRHRMTKSPEYKTWLHIRERCTNPRSTDFANYGGRGITVHPSWQTFECFLADMGRRPSPAHSIDRINNNGNYEPGNCRWATIEQQQRNRRSNCPLTFRGETALQVEWAERLQIRPSIISARLKAGWSTERTLTTPAKRCLHG